MLSYSEVNDVRRETAGMQWKILGSWKQYSGPEFSGFFGGFRQIPVVSGRIRPEIIGKNPENSGREYCFHVPDISRVSLQDPVTFPHLSCKKIKYHKINFFPWIFIIITI
jgi:hypothetical protein